jgi:ABC transporter substrate binding protein (PQQ-dependent alcohol dehydrogenase system)
MKTISLSLLLFGLLCLCANPAVAKKAPAPASKPLPPPKAAPLQADRLSIAYLRQIQEPPPQPFFVPQPDEEGLQGARLGVADNNTTGRFTGQHYALVDISLPPNGDLVAAFKQLLADGHRHILLDLPPPAIGALAALPEAANVLLYNLSASDDRLRAEECAANLLHLRPSRAMYADALAQYLAKKRWRDLFLVVGPQASDERYAAAIKRAATRLGLKIVAEKNWTHAFDERRTPEAEIPVFTQGVDYDVLVVADEAGAFGDLLAYRTWTPRPVVGTQGLRPAAWHHTHEQWGALQLQNRFHAQAGRWMSEIDYAAWLAARAIGEAATRVKSVEFDKIKAFLRSAEFSLAGFKGAPLSFRAWDGQLRQPVLLAAERSLIAVAPIEGFLHPKNELDTLGIDQSESRCQRSGPP